MTDLRTLERTYILADAEAWALVDMWGALRTVRENRNGSGYFGADRAKQYNDSVKLVRDGVKDAMIGAERAAEKAKAAYEAACKASEKVGQ